MLCLNIVSNKIYYPQKKQHIYKQIAEGAQYNIWAINRRVKQFELPHIYTFSKNISKETQHE